MASSPPSQTYQALVHSLSGIIGSVGAMTLTYPLLTLTTRLQLHQQPASSSCFSVPPPSPASNLVKVRLENEMRLKKATTAPGSIDAFFTIIKNEHWSALYSGMSTALTGTALSMGIYFFWYEFLKNWLQKKQIPFSTINSLVVAAIAGTINTVLTTPFWVVTTRMQSARRPKPPPPLPSPTTAERETAIESSTEDSDLTVTSTCASLWKEDGFGSFFRGLKPSLVLVLNPAIQFMVYEQLTRMLLIMRRRKLSSPSAATIGLSMTEIFVLGAIAKIAATVLTYPQIVIKTRLQAMKKPLSQGTPSSPLSSGLASAMASILRNEGITGFYHGMSTKIVQSVLNAAFLFVFKDISVSIVVKLLNLRRSIGIVSNAKP